MMNNYDKIAKYYDFLSRLLFFKAQVNSQKDQLSHIPVKSSILIAGGGTGWILEELSNLVDQGLSITYIEISAQMISLAKKRNIKNNQIEFINIAIENYNSDHQYDVIQTAFLFDNFKKDRTNLAFHKLNTLLKPGGLWLFSDFSYHPKSDSIWKGYLLKMMYYFFNRIAKVEAEELIETSVYFEDQDYEKVMERFYYQNFIKSIVYKKPLHPFDQ